MSSLTFTNFSWEEGDFVKVAKMAGNCHRSSKNTSTTLQLSKIFYLFNIQFLKLVWVSYGHTQNVWCERKKKLAT